MLDRLPVRRLFGRYQPILVALLLAASMTTSAPAAYPVSAAGDPVIAAAGDIACDPLERAVPRRPRIRQLLSTADRLEPAGRRPFRGGTRSRRRAVQLRQPHRFPAVVRPELGPGQVDHPPGRGQPRVPDLGAGPAVPAQTRAPQATSTISDPRPATRRRVTTASTSAPGTSSRSIRAAAASAGAAAPRLRASGWRPTWPPTRTSAPSPTGTFRCSVPAGGPTTGRTTSGSSFTTPTPI